MDETRHPYNTPPTSPSISASYNPSTEVFDPSFNLPFNIKDIYIDVKSINETSSCALSCHLNSDTKENNSNYDDHKSNCCSRNNTVIFEDKYTDKDSSISILPLLLSSVPIHHSSCPITPPSVPATPPLNATIIGCSTPTNESCSNNINYISNTNITESKSASNSSGRGSSLATLATEAHTSVISGNNSGTTTAPPSFSSTTTPPSSVSSSISSQFTPAFIPGDSSHQLSREDGEIMKVEGGETRTKTREGGTKDRHNNSNINNNNYSNRSPNQNTNISTDAYLSNSYYSNNKSSHLSTCPIDSNNIQLTMAPDLSLTSSSSSLRDTPYYSPLDPSRPPRFPYCITWTPLPLITVLLPIVGHIGIASSDGITHDFAGSYTINRGFMAFGHPTKLWRLDDGEFTAEDLDNAIAQADDKFGRSAHNIICNNCHHHVAKVLNILEYEGKRNWNQVDIAYGAFRNGLFLNWKSAIGVWGSSAATWGIIIGLIVIFSVIFG